MLHLLPCIVALLQLLSRNFLAQRWLDIGIPAVSAVHVGLGGVVIQEMGQGRYLQGWVKQALKQWL